MPSAALQRWQTTAASALDQIELAHAAVGGTGRGRRYATLQVNHAYAMLLSSQFQGFCRDLHSEAVDVLVTNLNPAAVRPAVRLLLTQGRKLDFGNPNPGNLGSDFGRLGIQFWPSVNALSGRNAGRQAKLETLNRWRNAIAHQDFAPVGGTAVRLKAVQVWRSACAALAVSFDRALSNYLAAVVGTRPW